MSRLKETATFFGEFRRAFKTTGAVLPSGRFLARAITRFAKQAARPARFLEVGPGTGALTGELISLLQAGDELTLVEINERFVELLNQRLETEPAWSPKKSQVKLIHASIETLPESERFRAIVCGLPFNNFEPDVVDRIFSALISHLESGGTFSFFEYWAIRGIKAPLVNVSERRRLSEVGARIQGYLSKYCIKTDVVPLNVPPALVRHLRRQDVPLVP